LSYSKCTSVSSRAPPNIYIIIINNNNNISKYGSIIQHGEYRRNNTPQFYPLIWKFKGKNIDISGEFKGYMKTIQ